MDRGDNNILFVFSNANYVLFHFQFFKMYIACKLCHAISHKKGG